MPRASIAPYNPEPVQHLLERAAARWPAKTAIFDGSHTCTFAELHDASGRLASALADRGVGKGSFVALLAPNCIAFEVAFFGVLKAGATVSTINSGYREREIAQQLGASGAEVLIVHHSLVDAAPARPGTAQPRCSLQRHCCRMRGSCVVVM